MKETVKMTGTLEKIFLMGVGLVVLGIAFSQGPGANSNNVKVKTNEVLEDYQVERLREWYSRNDNFVLCDADSNGCLNEEESKRYRSMTSFKYRFM